MTTLIDKYIKKPLSVNELSEYDEVEEILEDILYEADHHNFDNFDDAYDSADAGYEIRLFVSTIYENAVQSLWEKWNVVFKSIKHDFSKEELLSNVPLTYKQFVNTYYDEPSLNAGQADTIIKIFELVYQNELDMTHINAIHDLIEYLERQFYQRL